MTMDASKTFRTRVARALGALVVLLGGGLVLGQPAHADAAGYPSSAAEARRIRESLEKDIAAERDQPSPRAHLTAAREEFVALLREIEVLYGRVGDLDAEQMSRATRETLARNALAKPPVARSFRGSPSAEQINVLSSAAQDMRRKLEVLKARRAALESERDSGSKSERDRVAAHRAESAARLASYQAELPRLRDAASALEEQQAVEVRLHVLELTLEHDDRLLAFLARRAEAIPAQLALVDIEIEAAAKAVERADQELRAAWDAESAALGRVQREAEAARREAARGVESALGEWDRLLQAWRADSLSLDSRTAARKRELAAVQSAGLRADALDTAKARFDQLRERYDKSRAVGIDTVPLIQRGLERVAKDRETFLGGGERERWRNARADAVTALEDIETQLADLDETWRSTVASARNAWLAASAGEPQALTELWESEELPIWEEAQRQRRESLRALDDALRAISDEYQARLERADTLAGMLEVEERWLERRALLSRSPMPSVRRAAGQALVDYRAWMESGREVRWPVVAALVLLTLCWRIAIARVRRVTARWLESRGDVDASQLEARRAWRTVGLRASWVPLAPLIGWLAASVIDAEAGEARALVEAGWIGAAVLAIYALVRGLLTAVRDERVSRRYRRVAAVSAIIVLTLGLPHYYLGAINYESCNPDLTTLLGRVVRTTLAIAIGVALISRASLLALLPARMRAVADRRLGPIRVLLLVALVVTVIADWTGYAKLASWNFTAAFGSVGVLAVGIAAARTALQALAYGADVTVTDVLMEQRREFLLQQARTAVVLIAAAVIVWGLLLALRVAPADLQALMLRHVSPLQAEGSSALNVGAVWLALLVLVGTVVLARALRGALDSFVLAWAGMERDLRYSVSTVTHYLILFVGSAKALGKLGVDLKDLQWLLAAAGVGIGFGLQEIISNFVSGIIILFERPLKIGDVVEVDGRPGEVVDVSIRSTTVRTQDNKFVLVPNKEIITQRLTNFTGSDPKLRIDVPIGVAYGSDTGLVRDTLLEAARRHGRVFKRPPPDVLFKQHGDSSLDFVLRAWVHVKDRDEVASDLRYAIENALRRQQIEVPFPQRVVHVVSAPPIPLADGAVDARGDEGVDEHTPSDPRRLA
ncbi:MAG: mechanosensitive ion channel [bacterium]